MKKPKLTKSEQYDRDLTRYFEEIPENLRDKATFAGYRAWEDGYRAGFKAAKAAAASKSGEAK